MSIEQINQLQKLDFTKQLTFAYLTCERLYPNYVYFSENFHFGDSSVIRKAIDFLYNSIFEYHFNKKNIEVLIKRIDDVTPDTEDFSTIYVSSALDACTSVRDSLDFLIDKDFSRITYISSYAYDTVDMYVREIENINLSENFEQRVAMHPLMKKEILTQQGIVTFLTQSGNIDAGDIDTLLHLQKNEGKSNIKI